MQEGGPQLGLPQALVWWGQQCRSPWWLEMVEGGLGWGHASLGLGDQRKWLRRPQQRAPPPHQAASSTEVAQKTSHPVVGGQGWSFFKGILKEAHVRHTKEPACLGPVHTL